MNRIRNNKKMISAYLFLFLLSISTTFGQEEEKKEKRLFSKRFFIETSIGMQYRESILISTSPCIGYQLTDGMDIGAGISYNYHRERFKQEKLISHYIGGTTFIRQSLKNPLIPLLNPLFVQAQYELYHVKTNKHEYYNGTFPSRNERLSVGIGFHAPFINSNTSIGMIFSYDLMDALNSPSSSAFHYRILVYYKL